MLFLFLAFELINCGYEKSIFENPSYYKKNTLQTTYIQAFSMFSYERIIYYSNKFSIGITNLGDNLYRENEFALAYLINYKNMKIGLSIIPMIISIKDYSNGFSLGLNLGAKLPIKPNYSFSFAMHNINLPKIKGDKIPQRLIVNTKIEINKNIETEFEFFKETPHLIDFRVTNIICFDKIIFAIGVTTYPQTFLFSTIFELKLLLFSYSVSLHNTLGLTHIIGLNIKFSKN